MFSDPDPYGDFRRLELRFRLEQPYGFLHSLCARRLAGGLVELSREPSRKTLAPHHPCFAVLVDWHIGVSLPLRRTKEFHFFAELNELLRLAWFGVARGGRFALTEQIKDFFGTARSKQIINSVDRSIATTKVGATLYNLATSGRCVAATIFWMKSHGWRETTRVEHTGPDGKALIPVDAARALLESATDSRLAEDEDEDPIKK
jgi:hypothetical protein